jgi:energy-coupling factor transport system ATP-binding protein
MAHFEIKNLTFYYPGGKKPALEDINLKIEKGSYVTVCGKSGSGKTTLLRHLKSVLAPHGKRTGEILFEGRPLEEADLRHQSSKIGYVMQNPDDQVVTDKVWHELAFGLESLGTDQKTMRLRVAEMASYFGIQGWFHKNVAELSGGQKQLLNLASIMAMQPEVLILDEPTSQLDPIAAADFLNTVRKINLELGTTVIITEHRLEDILHASDQVVVVENGRIAACDDPRAIGRLLKEQNSEMFAAMPAPVQIFYGSGIEGDVCPLTVREGRTWLSRTFENREIKIRSLTEAMHEGSRANVLSGQGNPDAAVRQSSSDAADPQKQEGGEDYALTIKEAWFRYEKDAPDVLKGISFAAPRNKLSAIVGGNGTGKSTALKAICGICRLYRGKVTIDGKRLDKYKSGELFSGNLAMLPQDPKSLFVKKTVREELEEMIKGSRDKAAEAAEIAQLCDITALLDSHPYDLSGGEQQRTALAKVLLTRPRILLLDEPTKGMDNFFKIKFAGILEDLKKNGVTIVMVSHDVEFCARYADNVSMIFDGSIITTNTPDRFFSQNSFYTTAANRMSRHIFDNAITDEDVIKLCQLNR